MTPPFEHCGSWYRGLLRVVAEPAFVRGEFIPLNGANGNNPAFGRLPGETASGHWLYAYVRHDAASGQRMLVVANLHLRETLRGVRIVLPPPALTALGVAEGDGGIAFRDRLEASAPMEFRATKAQLRTGGLELPALAPLTAWYFEVQR